MLADDGDGKLYLPVMNYADGDMGATREMLTDPNCVPGLGDAGAHCTLICDASMPTFLLSYWSRDAAPSDRLPVEFAVKRQTADTAGVVGLRDRGVLAPGMRGRPQRHRPRRPVGRRCREMVHDLPGGREAARPAGDRIPRDRGRRNRGLRATARTPAPAPAASCGAPSPPRSGPPDEADRARTCVRVGARPTSRAGGLGHAARGTARGPCRRCRRRGARGSRACSRSEATPRSIVSVTST